MSNRKTIDLVQAVRVVSLGDSLPVEARRALGYCTFYQKPHTVTSSEMRENIMS